MTFDADVLAIILSNVFIGGAVYGAIRRDLRNHHERLDEQRGDLAKQREAMAFVVAELHDRINHHIEAFHTVGPVFDRRSSPGRGLDALRKDK